MKPHHLVIVHTVSEWASLRCFQRGGKERQNTSFTASTSFVSTAAGRCYQVHVKLFKFDWQLNRSVWRTCIIACGTGEEKKFFLKPTTATLQRWATSANWCWNRGITMWLSLNHSLAHVVVLLTEIAYFCVFTSHSYFRLGLHNILFQHQHRNVGMYSSHIAGRAKSNMAN